MTRYGLTDPRPLVHHVWTHAEYDTVQVSRLGRVGKDFTPRRITSLLLDSNDFTDLVELVVDVQVVDRLIFKTRKDLTSFLGAAVLSKPARGLGQERGKTEDKSREQHLTGDREAPLEARVGVEGGKA